MRPRGGRAIFFLFAVTLFFAATLGAAFEYEFSRVIVRNNQLTVNGVPFFVKVSPLFPRLPPYRRSLSRSRHVPVFAGCLLLASAAGQQPVV